MDPKKGFSVTLVAAEEGCYSIPITQRPSDQGRLHAEHELEAASSIRSLPPSSIAPSPKGFVDKIRRGIIIKYIYIHIHTPSYIQKQNELL